MKPYTPGCLPVESINYDSPLIAAMGAANRALANYGALLEQSPNPSLLFATLGKREALLSSRIEGSQSTLNEVLQFDADRNFAQGDHPGDQQRDDLSEIQNYSSALYLGEQELRNGRFSLDMLKALHGMLLGGDSARGKTKNPGSFRNRQNWIGPPGSTQETASFIPPAPHSLTGAMENWERFYLSSQPDPLIQVAILHGQFELIHPFEDGNGRLGRLLVPLFLYEKRVITQAVFYLSSYLEKHRHTYMRALRKLNQSPTDWNDWLLFFLKAISSQAEASSAKMQAIATLFEELKHRFSELTHSRFSEPLLEAIFENPIFSRRTVTAKLSTLETLPSGPTIFNLLRKLVEHKILTIVREGRGSRGALYELTPLIQLLENEE